MTHPNDMTQWTTDIACQRGHDTHATTLAHVNLGARHGYFDYPQIPASLARSFDMWVWDPAVHPVDGGPYCPAHDAVSETIISHGIWEPRETILALSVLESDASDVPGTFIDMGAQLGWFSLLALSCGRPVLAIEADPENAATLRRSADLNGWYTGLSLSEERIGPDTPPILWPPNEQTRLVKIDVEGAEPDALRMLWPAIEAGRVDHLLIEISPVFHDGYPQLVRDLIDAGYDAYRLPPKSQPPAALDRLPDDLLRVSGGGDVSLRRMVESLHQEDWWFARQGATW